MFREVEAVDCHMSKKLQLTATKRLRWKAGSGSATKLDVEQYAATGGLQKNMPGSGLPLSDFREG